PSEPVNFAKVNKIVFSLLGYMEHYKGTDILLKAWLSSEKLMSMKQMHLVVIGKSRMNYIPDIPSNSNITFEDVLLNDKAFTRWMELSDVVVLPYQSISQSGLMLTALSMNKLFIVNDVGEIAKPVKKYNLGWVIDESTAEGLRIQLEKIADEIAADGLPEIDADVINRVNADYSWETSGMKTGEIYRDLISGKNPNGK
ncbi:MAG: glycosyltransferase, partial [Clostridiales bacterium]|nr:glycosyltransferase [Clostridiales bacterium]